MCDHAAGPLTEMDQIVLYYLVQNPWWAKIIWVINVKNAFAFKTKIREKWQTDLYIVHS